MKTAEASKKKASRSHNCYEIIKTTSIANVSVKFGGKDTFYAFFWLLQLTQVETSIFVQCVGGTNLDMFLWPN